MDTRLRGNSQRSAGPRGVPISSGRTHLISITPLPGSEPEGRVEAAGCRRCVAVTDGCTWFKLSGKKHQN